MAAVEREMPAWQWISRLPASAASRPKVRIASTSASLRQQNVGARLDRIVKAQGRAKVRIERLERFRVRPFRVQNRQNMRDAAALVADDFVKSTNGECWEG